jgi:putative membrane protein
MPRLARLALATAGSLAATLAACGRGDADATPADTTRTDPRDTAAVAGGPLTDRGVVTLLSQLNGSEVGAAKGVLSKLGDPAVRAFAQRMVAEHGRLDSAVKALPVNATPMPHPPAQFITLQAASAHMSGVLAALPAGPAFDRAYLASQVADHGTALDSLRHWRGAVRDAALRTAVDGAMATVQAHLQDAHALQDALGAGAAAGPPAGPPPPPARLTPAEIRQPSGQPVVGTAPPARPDTTQRP